MADRPRIYADACEFVDIAKHQIGSALPADRAANVWHLWKLLEAHKGKDIELFTSTLTIAECTHADGNIDPKVRDLFVRLLASGQYVTLIQPTPFVAIDARDLRWKYGINLSGADYIHVASGLFVGCTEFLTTDAKITAQAKKIGDRGMKVCASSKTTLLPDKYRQANMLDENVTVLRPRTKNGND